jgi:hypothetical protein
MSTCSGCANLNKELEVLNEIITHSERDVIGERSAAVAYLRDRSGQYQVESGIGLVLDEMAANLQRGEHQAELSYGALEGLDLVKPLSEKERHNPAFYMPGTSEADYQAWALRYEQSLRIRERQVEVLERDRDALLKMVPKHVILDEAVSGDIPFDPVIAPPGRYLVDVNHHGAVSVILEDGKTLGVKPGEFRWTE